MSFASWYETPWHHPGLAWLATLLVCLLSPLLPSLTGARRRLLWGLQLVAALDALCTGAWSPLAGRPGLHTAAVVLFVILGDARYFFLLQDPTLSSPSWRRHLSRALLLGAGFSLLAYGLAHALPAAWQSPRTLFLTYEALFVGLLLLLPRLLPPASAQLRRLQRRLTGFELTQYGLWVAADLWILFAGAWADWGYALRLLPNALYYAGFAGFAALYGTLPAESSSSLQSSPDLDETPSLAV